MKFSLIQLIIFKGLEKNQKVFLLKGKYLSIK